MIQSTRDDIELDVEWVELISEARELGITMEEIQQFLRGQAPVG